MPLSPSALASEVRTDPAKIGYAAPLAAGNLPAIKALGDLPNQSAQAPPVLAEVALMQLLTDPANGSAVKLLNYVNLALVKADIDANDHAAVAAWAAKLTVNGTITAGEAQAIASYCSTPVPTTMGRWEVLGGAGYSPSIRELEIALNGATP